MGSQPKLQSTNDLLNSLYKEQYKGSMWNLDQERVFIENLFCQRFNFLLVAYALIITAAASTGSHVVRFAILLNGAFLVMLIGLSIIRAYVKLITILRILHRIGGHPFEIIQKEAEAFEFNSNDWMFSFGLGCVMARIANFVHKWMKPGVNEIVGVFIPFFCFVSLIAASILPLRRLLAEGWHF